MADAEIVHRLANPARLARWLAERGLHDGPLSVRRITSGTVNEIFELDIGSDVWLLRRPTEHSVSSATTTEREYRVLSALAGTPVPAPRAIALCTDAEIVGAPFFLMSKVEGFIFRMPLPAPYDCDLEARRKLAFSYIEGIATLANVDWRAQGLEGFGKPEGFLERQARRWLPLFRKSTVREVPELEQIGRWLEQKRPTMQRAGIIHGDFHRTNSLVACDAPRLAGIIDWEQSTIGDPLLDLGWFLALYAEPGERHVSQPPEEATWDQPGFPTRRELVAHYGALTGLDTARVCYYEVLALFKLACVLEAAHTQFVQGRSKVPIHARYGEIVLNAVRRAGELIRSEER